MNRTMLRAKVHRIRVTECEVEYEGSLTLDAEIMESARMVPYEKIDVYDVDNGNRFSTYLIAGEPGSKVCCVNGAAARLVENGDKLIICTFVTLEDDDAAAHRPRVVLVGEENEMIEVKDYEEAGVRVPS
ncbi:MAG: aspartate 1-decarboxylase [bacterium]|nr:aspartate 1-decarboxylase [bacterium]